MQMLLQVYLIIKIIILAFTDAEETQNASTQLATVLFLYELKFGLFFMWPLFFVCQYYLPNSISPNAI